MSELVRRATATEKTLLKYRNQPFDWATGATCIHLARTQLRNMGHRPPSIPYFRSAIGAERALKASGHANLASLLDSMLPRIAPASMLLGDLALMQGDPPFDALLVSAGGKLLGWHEDDPSGIKPIVAHQIEAAWRV